MGSGASDHISNPESLKPPILMSWAPTELCKNGAEAWRGRNKQKEKAFGERQRSVLYQLRSSIGYLSLGCYLKLSQKHVVRQRILSDLWIGVHEKKA